MDELIWIGNTLYPRWYVITVVALVVSAPFLFYYFVRLLRWLFG